MLQKSLRMQGFFFKASHSQHFRRRQIVADWLVRASILFDLLGKLQRSEKQAYWLRLTFSRNLAFCF